jgi:hypothetical protein
MVRRQWTKADGSVTGGCCVPARVSRSGSLGSRIVNRRDSVRAGPGRTGTGVRGAAPATRLVRAQRGAAATGFPRSIPVIGVAHADPGVFECLVCRTGGPDPGRIGRAGHYRAASPFRPARILMVRVPLITWHRGMTVAVPRVISTVIRARVGMSTRQPFAQPRNPSLGRGVPAASAHSGSYRGPIPGFGRTDRRPSAGR